MSNKPNYIHLTEADTHHVSRYAHLKPIKALHTAKRAYVQQIATKKATVYLLNEDTQELEALWVHIEPNYAKCCNNIYLLPHQKRTRSKAEPLYYFATSYWERDSLIDWLKSFGLQVYYAAGVGTCFSLVK